MTLDDATLTALRREYNLLLDNAILHRKAENDANIKATALRKLLQAYDALQPATLGEVADQI